MEVEPDDTNAELCYQCLGECYVLCKTNVELVAKDRAMDILLV